jgi:hypothetical protein
MHTPRRLNLSVATLLLLALAPPSFALINPNFTPVHLVNQSTLVVELELAPVKDGKCVGTVKQVLKGKLDARTLTFNLAASQMKEHAAALTQRIAANGSQSVIFFAGDLHADDAAPGAAPGGEPGAEAGAGGQKGFLHIQGDWVSFNTENGVVWQMEEISSKMGATWRGGTDMLILCVKYILSDPDAVVPSQEGVSWGETVSFAKIAGAVHAVLPVDLKNDGTLSLYVAAESGDRLFTYDAKTKAMKDLTAAMKLTAKSRQAV